jgi:hypothetical protein
MLIFPFCSFLTVDADTYLPRYENVTIYFLKDLLSGRKKRVKNTQVKHISVPLYDNLTVAKICDFLQSHPQVANWLPDLREVPRLPKEFLCNIAFTVIGKSFGEFVKSRIEMRNSKITTERQLNIELDAELANAFAASTAVSSK